MKIDIAPSLYLYFRFKQEGAMLVSEKKMHNKRNATKIAIRN